jgi:hypothetical protein
MLEWWAEQFARDLVIIHARLRWEDHSYEVTYVADSEQWKRHDYPRDFLDQAVSSMRHELLPILPEKAQLAVLRNEKKKARP